MSGIVRIEARGEPVLDQPREDRRVRGAPLRRTWLAHETQGMSSGVWTCEVGRWRIVFAANKQEFFHVIEGRVRLHDEAGGFEDFGPGDAAVIPAGFVGEFEVIEAVRKHFVIVER